MPFVICFTTLSVLQCLLPADVYLSSYKVGVVSYRACQIAQQLVRRSQILLLYCQKQVAQQLLDFLWALGNLHDVFKNPPRRVTE